MTTRNFNVTILLAVMLLMNMGATNPPTRTTRRDKLELRIDSISGRDDILDLTNAIPADTDSLIIASYDKPLRSLRETFFVTNHYDSDLTSVTMEFTYKDDDGLMLHSRTVTIVCRIPPGETRQLYTTAWDRQYTYYYHGTRIKPKSKGAISYYVDISPKFVTLMHRKEHSK
ncbi:MAG: hypothetical protein NC127_01220 [Muribaculum sp.]|nr:hypothetical protein [Muribaculum sp.]